MNPLRELQDLGQSIWLDDIRRIWLTDGTLLRRIRDDGVTGVTANPAIFAQAIRGGTEYEAVIRRLAGEGMPALAIYEALALADVQGAADALAEVFATTGGRDGFVSLEVSPRLADDTEGTLREARRLWAALDRPNVLIKVPATPAGLPAIRALLAAGINVNVTLLFDLPRYREVVEAFLAGLEVRAEGGLPLARVASVASFFLSRIDTEVDARLDLLASDDARALRGQAAIASARLAYEVYREWSGSPRWRRLADRGARPQRLLWASTSTKDPAYPDTRYVEALIGPETIATLPGATLDAYRDHGRPALRLGEEPAAARALPQALSRLGIDLDAVGRKLERDGVRKFLEPFDALEVYLATRRAESAATRS